MTALADPRISAACRLRPSSGTPRWQPRSPARCLRGRNAGPHPGDDRVDDDAVRLDDDVSGRLHEFDGHAAVVMDMGPADRGVRPRG